MSVTGELEKLLERARMENAMLSAENVRLKKLVRLQSEMLKKQVSNELEDEQLFKMMHERPALSDGALHVVLEVR